MNFLKDINEKDSHKRLISLIGFGLASLLVLSTYILSYVFIEFPAPEFSYYAIYTLFGVSGYTTTATLMEKKK